MNIKKSLICLSVASVMTGSQAHADWGSVKITNGTHSSTNPVVIPAQISPAQKQGLLRQQGQLLSKKKQYQALIRQVNNNMIKRPDLKANLLTQLRNYKTLMSRVDSQLTQVNQRLSGRSASVAAQQPIIRADNNAVVALAAQFGLKSKALVHFPELIKAKNDTEKKIIIKKKLARTGYRTSARNASTVIDDRLLFENGSAALLPAASQRVENLAALYHRYGSEINRVVVKGHTNSVGDSRYNLQLSRARSNKVKAELMRLKVPASAIISQGFGENELLPNINPASALNRRVEYGVIKR